MWEVKTQLRSYPQSLSRLVWILLCCVSSIQKIHHILTKMKKVQYIKTVWPIGISETLMINAHRYLIKEGRVWSYFKLPGEPLSDSLRQCVGHGTVTTENKWTRGTLPVKVRHSALIWEGGGHCCRGNSSRPQLGCLLQPDWSQQVWPENKWLTVIMWAY